MNPSSGSQERVGGRGWFRGEILLALFVVIASGILVRESRRMAGAEGPAAASTSESSGPLAGFRSDAWYLPDDPLLGFVPIPAGPFLMGSDPSLDPMAYENERWSPAQVQGIVDLPTYFLGRTEVTVAQFRAFVAATGRNTDPGTLAGPLDHPVVLVSWPDALAYARWLDARLREWPDTPETLTRFLEAGGRVTLPSEAEWEKAARGSDGRIFPWGNEPRADRANLQGTGTLPVGTYPCPECPYPVADLSGNVWEWTRSPFEPYPLSPGSEPSDLQADALWVMRGGAFNEGPQNARAGTRGGADPGARRPFIGFRVVLTAP